MITGLSSIHKKNWSCGHERSMMVGDGRQQCENRAFIARPRVFDRDRIGPDGSPGGAFTWLV